MKGAEVTELRLYPDFDIDQYWGADVDNNKRPDIVRVVVEIASFKKNSEKSYGDAVVQLQSYLEGVGERWDKRLVGLAILGNRAYLMHITEDDPRIREVYEDSDSDDDNQSQNDNWMSLFDPRVVEVLDEMHALCMDDDDGDDDDDDDEYHDD